MILLPLLSNHRQHDLHFLSSRFLPPISFLSSDEAGLRLSFVLHVAAFDIACFCWRWEFKYIIGQRMPGM